MQKIKDRFTLGIISGLIGNLAKEAVGSVLIKGFKFGTLNGAGVASGIFLPKLKAKYLRNPKVKLIGYVGDMIIGASLGVVSVYLLSATGGDNHRLKGIGTGHFTWTALYGVLQKMGASSVYPLNENNNLNAIINHSVYGLVTAEVAVRLGDESLFKPNEAKNSLLSTPAEQTAHNSKKPRSKRFCNSKNKRYYTTTF